MKLGCLKVWILGRQFEDAQDYWDGNWLAVEALCQSGRSRVAAKGPILHLSELSAFRDSLRILDKTLKGEAELNCVEPNLHIKLASSGSRGHIESRIELTPDHMLERHEFRETFDQTYLAELLRDLDHVLRKYPIRSPR